MKFLGQLCHIIESKGRTKLYFYKQRRIPNNLIDFDVIREDPRSLGIQDFHISYCAPGIVIKNIDVLNNLENITINQQEVNQIEGLSQLKKLKNLKFTHNELPQIKWLSNLSSLEELTIINNKITDTSGIEDLYHLKKLHLSHNRIEKLCGLEKLENLEELYLYHNKIEKIESLINLKKLRILELSNNSIKKIEGLNSLTNLKELYLSANQISEIFNLNVLKNLETLILSSNQIEKIKNLDQLENLILLKIDYNKITEIENLKNLKKLKTLVLNGNMIKEVKNLGELSNLEFINLKKNPLNKISKMIMEKPIPDILEFCRRISQVNLFMSHALVDFERFKIGDMVNFLEKKEEIYHAYYCERDMAGNIDRFMKQYIPKSQILVFFASKKSLFNSPDCKFELKAGRERKLPLIIVYGGEVNKQDLEKAGLSSQYLQSFDSVDYNQFLDEIYAIIKNVNTQIRQKQGANDDSEKLVKQLQTEIDLIVSSDDFYGILHKNLSDLSELDLSLDCEPTKLARNISIVFKKAMEYDPWTYESHGAFFDYDFFFTQLIYKFDGFTQFFQ